MPDTEGKQKESYSDIEDDFQKGIHDKKEGERYIQLFKEGYKEKKENSQSPSLFGSESSLSIKPEEERTEEDPYYRVALDKQYNDKIQERISARERMLHRIEELDQDLEEARHEAVLLSQVNTALVESEEDRERQTMRLTLKELSELLIEREEEQEELCAQLTRHKEEISVLSKERDQERQAVQDLIDQCEGAKERLEASERYGREMRSRLDQLLGERSSTTVVQQKELSSFIKKLEAKVKELEEKSSTAARLEEKSHKEAQELRETVNEQRRALEDINQRLSAKMQKNQRLKQRLSLTEHELDTKKAELDELKTSCNVLHQRCQEMVDIAKCKMGRAERRSIREKKQRDSLSEGSPRDLKEAERKLSHQRNKVERLDLILAELAQSNLTAETQITKWEEQLSTLCNRKQERDKQDQKEKGDTASSEKDDYSSEQHATDSEIHALENQVTAGLKRIRELTKSFEKAQRRREQAARECGRLVQLISALEQQHPAAGEEQSAQRRPTEKETFNQSDVALLEVGFHLIVCLNNFMSTNGYHSSRRSKRRS